MSLTADKKEEYLSHIARNHMKKELNLKILLVESLLYIGYKGSTDNRFLGAMESVLILNDYLTGGKQFDLTKKENKSLFMIFRTKETYRELIVKTS